MYTLATLSLIAGVSALTVPRSTCSFGLTASGDESGTIGQLSDGQNRIGGGLAPATFTISNGGITDAAGRGCVLTPSVEQFQCDQGVGPTYGFAIENNGTLTSSGSPVFYACPASDTEWNLYTTPVIGQKKCVEISLTASGCGAEFSSSSATPQAVTTVTVYDCGMVSSIAPVFTESTIPVIPIVSASEAVAPSSATTPAVGSPTSQGVSSVVIESSIPAESTTPVISSAVSTSEVIVTSSETAPAVSLTSQATSEASSVVGSSTPLAPVKTTTLVTMIESSSPASIAPSSTGLTTSYYSHSVICSSSGFGTSTTPAMITTTAPATSQYPTTAPYSNTTLATSSVTTSAVASSASSSSSCVATTLTGSDTAGNYQYPHLIIPVSSTSPDTAYGTQFFGTISSNRSTIFNFDIPSSYSGSTCNLIFLLPLQSELETSSYTFSGSGEIEFEQLSSAATFATTYDNAPWVESVLGDFTISEGSSTLISSFSCPAGETLTYELKSLQDTYLYYFQDWNPSPIGLFITYC